VSAQNRADRLAERLPVAGLDAILVTDLTNVRYLTGYTGTNGLAVVGPKTRVFVTDFRYVEQAAEEVYPSFERRRGTQDLLEVVEESLPDGSVRLGFEDAHVSVRHLGRLEELLSDRVELIGVTGLVEGLRAVKDDDEVAAIQAATELADRAFESLLAGGLIGRSERELALALEFRMRELGASGPSFPPIVAGGPHGALPHAQPRARSIEPGQLVVIDWGAQLDGYCSDCTRTVAAGEVDEDARTVYELVLEAQLAGLEAVTAGASAREVDGAARRVIDAGGHGEHFGHGLGHGVGLDIHEAPRLAQRSDDVLVSGNVVTVEPGIYLPGVLGIRIEDLTVVADGTPQILTAITKDLIVTD
jgi:Xaa-Pro aminopeptidase